MYMTTYLKNAVNATACSLCIFRKAFDEWSPARLGDITFLVGILWTMDILVKRWVRIARASKGSIFKAKTEPGQKTSIKLGLHRYFGQHNKIELPPSHCSDRRKIESRRLL